MIPPPFPPRISVFLSWKRLLRRLNRKRFEAALNFRERGEKTAPLICCFLHQSNWHTYIRISVSDNDERGCKMSNRTEHQTRLCNRLWLTMKRHPLLDLAAVITIIWTVHLHIENNNWFRVTKNCGTQRINRRRNIHKKSMKTITGYPDRLLSSYWPIPYWASQGRFCGLGCFFPLFIALGWKQSSHRT